MLSEGGLRGGHKLLKQLVLVHWGRVVISYSTAYCGSAAVGLLLLELLLLFRCSARPDGRHHIGHP